jgi:YVTN family beta-propeller protein
MIGGEQVSKLCLMGTAAVKGMRGERPYSAVKSVETVPWLAAVVERAATSVGLILQLPGGVRAEMSGEKQAVLATLPRTYYCSPKPEDKCGNHLTENMDPQLVSSYRFDNVYVSMLVPLFLSSKHSAMKMFLSMLLTGVFILAGSMTCSCLSVPEYLSPTVLAATDKTLFIACATANRVLCMDMTKQQMSTIELPLPPSGLVLSRDCTKLFVTCVAPESEVCVVDLKKKKIIGTLPAGHSATAPVLSLDGKTLYVCNQFNNDVDVINVAAKKEVCLIHVEREPVAAEITKDGKVLLVANQLPTGRADLETVAAVVSVIDLSVRKVVKELQLPNGSGSLKDIRVSPDGKYAVVTHLVSNFNRLTTKVRFGWMNANAMTIIDLAPMKILATVLLDEPNRGAANPWGAAWSADDTWLAIAHAGTHEVSLINFPMLLANLLEASETYTKTAKPALTYLAQYEGFDPGPPFLTGARERIKLPQGDLGPRALTFVKQKLYVADYFSDTLSVIDLESPERKVESIPLGSKTEMDPVRKGEYYFHDATICLQGWQSCSSCHPGNARVDGFNWDLLNDGIGNPKNVRSLLLAHKTPPVMFLGVRTNAETAVRAGIKFILFTKQPEEVPAAIDEYLKSLKPLPSPYLVHGKLSAAAKRGEKIFQGSAGCEECHAPGLFTDLHPHNVGTRRTFDGPKDKFYTPTLIEVWRTAPYLHDGSAASIRDVLTTRNPEGEHGDVTSLSEQEIDDLCEYVLSL